MILRILLWLGLALPVGLGALTVATPVSLEAQLSTIAGVEDEAARYREALAQVEALRAVVQEVEGPYRRAAQRIEARSDDGDERGRAEVFRDQFIDSAMQLIQLEMTMQSAQEELREARRTYLRALDDQRERLVNRLEDPTLPEEAEAETNRAIVALVVEHSMVERERDPLEEYVLRPFPRLEPRVTDGPQELLLKADYMENQVANAYGSVVEALDDEIERLEQRLRQQRALGDQQADLARFDADRLVGGGVGAIRGEEEGSDALPLFSDRPLAEQVELLRSVRVQALDRRTEALDEADRFRRLASGGVE